MADNDNRRKLYDNINKEYDLPDYDQFSKDMEDDTKRKRLYDAVAKEYDLPDYNKFSQDMGYGQQEVQTNNQQKYPRSHRRNSHYNHSRQQLWTAAMQKRAMTNRRQHTTNNMPRHIINLPKKVGLGWE